MNSATFPGPTGTMVSLRLKGRAHDVRAEQQGDAYSHSIVPGGFDVMS